MPLLEFCTPLKCDCGSRARRTHSFYRRGIWSEIKYGRRCVFVAQATVAQTTWQSMDGCFRSCIIGLP